ncbi:serine/threonine-protein kinase ndrD [Salix suchowensis]|nr:serine/threonine-protein kinase ndrD [Salix suchowensis]
MLGPGSRFPDNQVHSRDSCSYHGVLSYGVLTRKTAEKYCNHHGWDNTGMFGAQRKDVQDEASGPPRSPQRRRNHYRSLSPSSKAQAIARGQKELSEMVSRMPEGCYELSLRDLVEQPMVFDDVKEESFGKDRNINNQDERILRRGKEKKKNVEKKSQMNRSGSLNNEGFLLKMVSPISFGLRKKKKIPTDGKVSPRPFLFDNGPEKSVDEEWWKNKFSQSKVSENGAGLTNSNSIGSSKRSSSSKSISRNGSGGCWSFIFAKKGKAAD